MLSKISIISPSSFERTIGYNYQYTGPLIVCIYPIFAYGLTTIFTFINHINTYS